MDAAPEAARLQLRLALGRAVGAVGINILRRVGLVQKTIERLAVVHARIAHVVTPDQFVLGVRIDVVLVAKEALVVLLGAARIFGLLPLFRGRLLGLPER